MTHLSNKSFSVRPIAVLAIAALMGSTALAQAQRYDRPGWSGHGGYSRSIPRDRGGYGTTRPAPHYGSNSNVFHDRPVARVTIDHIPPLERGVPRGNRGYEGYHHSLDYGRPTWEWNHHDLFHDGFRYGYYHYDRYWRDDSFVFGFYLFAPVGAYVYSPWYYYPSLPPYIAEDKTIIVADAAPTWDWDLPGWQDYQWEFPKGRTGDFTDLDYALEDLTLAFEGRNMEAISRLCPTSGRVAIYTEGKYSYSLNSSDFFDTFQDGALGPHTNHYRILSVRTNGHDDSNVLAEQDFTDPWGKHVDVYHSYRLKQEGPNVVIRSFGTYKNRPW